MTTPAFPRRLLAPAALVLAACAGGGGAAGGSGWTELTPESPGTGPATVLLGTVRHLDLEGGLYVIETPDGTRYNPVNLPDAFRTDGKAVEAEARRRDDVMSIGMVGPVVELLRIRERTAGGSEQEASESVAPAESPAPAESSAGTGLTGTTWLLEDLAGRGVVDRVQATLEFPEAGSAAGNGSCNRFRGPVTVSGESIRFGPLAATRKACPEAVMNQETAYMAALAEAERYEIRDGFLYIHGRGGQPLRFTRQ